jgi:hypothetical protein
VKWSFTLPVTPLFAVFSPSFSMTPNWFDAPEFPRQASPNRPKIPAERELARELYVSVTTIRTALKALEQEGKIEHAPGRWTICAIATLGPFFSFAQEMKLRLTT